MSLVTLADYEARFGDVPTADEPKVQQLLDDATSFVQQLTEQRLEKVDGDVVFLDVESWRYSKLFLPELPVRNVSAVVDHGTAVPASDYWWFSYGRLEKPYSTWKAEGPRTVQVTYDHGFDPTPDWLVSILCSIAYRGTKDATINAVQSQSFVDAYAVTYGSRSWMGSQIGVTDGEHAQLMTLRALVVAM